MRGRRIRKPGSPVDKILSTPGAPAALHLAVEQHLTELGPSVRLRWSAKRGVYVLWRRTGKQWGEEATYRSIREFAEAEGLEVPS